MKNFEQFGRPLIDKILTHLARNTLPGQADKRTRQLVQPAADLLTCKITEADACKRD